MIFTYGEHEAAVGVDANVTEAECACRGDRACRALPVDRVQPPVGELGVDDGTARDVVLTAAILVNPITHIGRRGSDLDRRTAR
jgi:hypothetical protein